uniref:Uncharacterized protein n=1 Tax=Ditylenchus dipsaci TaxID=166011 RepID=A0A915DHG3_9BILA
MRLENSTIDCLAKHGEGPKINHSKLQQKQPFCCCRPNFQIQFAFQPANKSKAEFKTTKEAFNSSSSLAKYCPQSGLLPVASQAVVTPLHYLDYLQDQKYVEWGSSGKAGVWAAFLNRAVNKWLLAEKADRLSCFP